jgi:hypothetical protein
LEVDECANILAKTGVHYIDITPISRDAKNDVSLTAAHGLHPSAIQYHKSAELLAPEMFNAIR